MGSVLKLGRRGRATATKGPVVLSTIRWREKPSDNVIVDKTLPGWILGPRSICYRSICYCTVNNDCRSWKQRLEWEGSKPDQKSEKRDIPLKLKEKLAVTLTPCKVFWKGGPINPVSICVLLTSNQGPEYWMLGSVSSIATKRGMTCDEKKHKPREVELLA